VLDISDISNFDSNRAELMRKHLDHDKSENSESLRSISTRFWYESLVSRYGLKTAYQAEKFFEPDAFTYDSAGKILHSRNKWHSYENGTSRPRAKMLNLVEAKAPGSTRLINHPLWTALDTANTDCFLSDNFLRQLTPDVQSLVLGSEAQDACFSTRKKITTGTMSKLLRISSVDTLAVLSWLIRERSLKNLPDNSALFLGLHFSLLIMSLQLYNQKVVYPLLHRMLNEIYPLALSSSEKIAMTAIDYIDASLTLNTLAHHKLIAEKSLTSWLHRTKMMAKLINGDYGLDIRRSLLPSFI